MVGVDILLLLPLFFNEMIKIDKVYDSLDVIKNLTVEYQDGFIEVMAGNLSNALFFLYHHLIFNDTESLNRGISIIESNLDLAGDHIHNCKFAYGYPGLVWLLEFLRNQEVLEPVEIHDQSYIDNIFISSINYNKEIKIYDLFVGLVGQGLCFLERKELSEHALLAIKKIIDFFNSTTNQFKGDELELAWQDFYTCVHDDLPRQKKEYFNLGLAHGIPSIISFLCNCVNRNIEIESCLKLIKKGCYWLLNFESTEFSPLLFPCKVLLKGDEYPKEHNKKLAWCYGDLGVSVALTKAGKILKDNFLLSKAREIALNASKIRKWELSQFVNFTNSVDDLCFCHGSVGVSHIFSQLYSFHRDRELKVAADYWLEDTVNNMHRIQLENSTGILEGLPGIGMVLLDYVNSKRNKNVKYEWNKLFLTNI